MRRSDMPPKVVASSGVFFLFLLCLSKYLFPSYSCTIDLYTGKLFSCVGYSGNAREVSTFDRQQNDLCGVGSVWRSADES